MPRHAKPLDALRRDAARLVSAGLLLVPRASMAQEAPVAPANSPASWAAAAAVHEPTPTSPSRTVRLSSLARGSRDSLPRALFEADTAPPARRRLSGKGAVLGAGIGLVIGGAVGGYLDSRNLSTHGSLFPRTATGGVILGALLGAGGGAARRGAGIGLLVGGALGVLVGLAALDGNCDGSCGGLGALAGGGVGATAGVVLGAVIGMANQGDGSQPGPADRVHLSVAPSRAGIRVGASIAL
jgi:hypothetical protein